MAIETAAQAQAPARARRGMSRQTWRGLITGLLFISPWVLGFLLFTLYPMAISLVYSFSEVKFNKPLKFIGLANYVGLFQDVRFWRSLGNTAYIVCIAVPLQLLASFICALLLNIRVKGQAFYRVIYYLPAIVPAVASTLLWYWLLRADDGLVNHLLGLLGIQGPLWINSPQWSKPSLVLLGLWGLGGTMVIYLAGLQDVPQSLYESAELDGAGWLYRLWHVTIPLISSITLFNLVIGVIDAFQYFSQAYVVGRLATANSLGAPQDSTLFYALLLYDKLVNKFQIGQASAMAWILFVIILCCTLVILRSSKRWAYYEDAT
jgi:multiple sugar transport system permease protein